MISKIKTAILNPRRAVIELNRLYQRQLRDRGISIPGADWDTLIILDACRYDVFKEHSRLNGSLSQMISQGSHTSEFLIKNFDDQSFPDMVYVSATPQIRAHELENNFHAVVPVWEDGWDDSLNTVPPKEMVEATQQAHEKYPKKRIVAHFLQPHYPFIGGLGRQIKHGTVTGDGVLKKERDAKSIWDRLEAGEISADLVWNAYIENLELVLPKVETLVGTINGKIVITSDHGNIFGKWGVYGHPPKTYLTDLVEIPWLEPTFDRRRKIIAEETTTAIPTNDVTDQLRDLGYR